MGRRAGVRVMAVVGEELGTIMGKDYKRNENGDIIVDPTTGIPSVRTTTPRWATPTGNSPAACTPTSGSKTGT